MTQTFEQYLQQHDGSNEFTNRRREQVLADARRSSEAYLEEIDKETTRNGLHALKPDSELAIPRGWVYEPKPQPSVGMSRADYVRMFNPNGIM